MLAEMAAEAIRKALSMGADKAVHLLDGGSDLVIMDGHDWHGNTARRSGASRLGLYSCYRTRASRELLAKDNRTGE